MILIDWIDGEIVAEIPFSLKDFAKLVPGAAWNKEIKRWTYPGTVATAERLMDLFQGHGYETSIEFDLQLSQAREVAESVNQIRRGHVPDVNWQSAIEPRSYQKQAHAICMSQPGTLLDMGMGTGKTKVAVDVMAAESSLADQYRALIVCPLSVMVDRVWPREFEKHEMEMPIFQLDGNSTRKKSTQLATADRDHDKYAVVINYDSFWRGDIAKSILAKSWDIVVADESHMIRTPTSSRSKFAWKLTPKSRRRLALSGTPIVAGPENAFSQFKFLDPSIFGNTFTSFKHEYCILQRIGQGHRIAGYKNLDRFKEKMASISFTVPADVVDLPEFVDIDRHVELPKRIESIYARAHDDLSIDLGHLNAGTIAIQSALTSVGKLQQICDGFARDTETNTDHWLHESKLAGLMDLLEDEIPQGEPVVIFVKFRKTIEMIREAIKDSFGALPCGLSGDYKTLSDWPEKSPFLVTQIQSGNMGVDLSRAAYCIYYSIDWPLDTYEQSRKRVHRHGQTRMVRYIHLITQVPGYESIDEKIRVSLAKKQNFAEFLKKGVDD